jgi:(p)ppGpp synthase/HD superfamily hydrolase
MKLDTPLPANTKARPPLNVGETFMLLGRTKTFIVGAKFSHMTQPIAVKVVRTHPCGAVECVVVEGLPAWCSDEARHAAILHDVFEDTRITADDLKRSNYPDRVIFLVQALTRKPGTTYADYIQSIKDSGDRELIAIKLADIADNLDPERVALLPPDHKSLVKRYEKAREALLS